MNKIICVKDVILALIGETKLVICFDNRINTTADRLEKQLLKMGLRATKHIYVKKINRTYMTYKRN